MVGTEPEAKATTATIKAGRQHLSVVALEQGFRTAKTIWDHPPNAALKKKRVNHNTLAPGDEVELPVFEDLEAPRATNQTHKFTVPAAVVLLNLKIHDSDGQAFGKRAFVLTTAEGPGTDLKEVTPRPGETTPAGEINQEVSPRITEGELRISQGAEPPSPVEVAFRLLIGHLGPPNTIRGQQARLNNLGYFAGFSEKDVEQLRWAIEEFQHDHGMTPTGKTDDPKTFNKIAHVHGDLLASEQVP